MISDAYLKMLLSLPDDFFKDWEWKHCDYAINIEKIEAGVVTPLEEQFHTDIKILYVDSVFKDIEWVNKDVLIPIPSQKQLTIMLKMQLGHDVTDFYILKYVTAWHERGDLNRLENVCSEVLFLEVLLWMKGKIWNGEKWL